MQISTILRNSIFRPACGQDMELSVLGQPATRGKALSEKLTWTSFWGHVQSTHENKCTDGQVFTEKKNHIKSPTKTSPVTFCSIFAKLSFVRWSGTNYFIYIPKRMKPLWCMGWGLQHLWVKSTHRTRRSYSKLTLTFVICPLQRIWGEFSICPFLGILN